MKRRKAGDIRAKLLLTILRSPTIQDAVSALTSDDVELARELEGGDLRSTIASVASSSTQDFALRLERLSKAAGHHWVEAAAYAKLASLGFEAPLPLLLKLSDGASGKLPPDSYFWITLNVLQACACRATQDREAAGFYCREAEGKLASTDHAMLRLLASPQLLIVKASLTRSDGDFATAHRCLEEAVDISRRHDLRTLGFALSELASLLWASGQFRKALEIHRDPDSRQKMASLGSSVLLTSHLSAAKCAIDLGDKEVATSELRAAEQLLRESSDLPKMLRGYTILYLGELEILHGRLDPAVAKFNEACDWFEAMDPPFHAGLLDAKIAMAHHAISKREHKRLFPIIHKLLEEADEKGCLEARARLLVLESALFVSENPPLRAAFEDLVTRMHLIQNPALMLQALANLYVHSLRYLDQPDQAFLMARLRRLQKVLEESHYQDLYEQHIEKRYSWAIENRLAEFLEAEESLLEEEEPEKG